MKGKRRFIPGLILLLLVGGCNYGRMNEQESIRTYEASLPDMPQGPIPFGGGIEMLKRTDPKELKNPLPATTDSVGEGKGAYEYFCLQCHGPKADGNGTVGQSFAPLPTDLKSPVVQRQMDGSLFYKISFGYQRHPPLASTVSENDRWAIVLYLRSLTKNSGS